MKLSEEYNAYLCACLEPGTTNVHRVYEEAQGLRLMGAMVARVISQRTACGVDMRGHSFADTADPVTCPLCMLALTDPDVLKVDDKVPAGTAS